MHQILNFTRQGQPFIIIHGLFGSSRNWQGLAKQFAVHYDVITLDLRNHGDSFHADSMDYPLMAADVIALMDQLQLDQAYVLGHSMGGKVAMTLCHEYPQRFDKLVVADIAPVSYSHDYDDIILPILQMDLANLANRQQADQSLASSIADQRIRLFLLQNLVFEQGQAHWMLNWPVLQRFMPQITGFADISDWHVPHPSLFIRGGLSDYVDERAWQLIQQHFEQAELVTLPQAGHWLHADKPEAFVDAVVAFLGK